MARASTVSGSFSAPQRGGRGRRSARLAGRFLRSITRLAGPVGPVVAWRLAKRLFPHLAQTNERISIRARGLLWQLDLHDTLQRHIFCTGAYEQPLLRQVLRRLEPGDTVLDVGANIGAFTLPVARQLAAGSGGRVVAIEPAADAFHRLVQHVSINRLDSRVLAHRVALGTEPGVEALRGRGRGSREDLGWRSLVGAGPIVEEVEVVRGDRLLDDLDIRRVDVLKVDVEGFEAEVLGGLSRLLERHPPRLVVMELVERHQRAAGGSTDDLVGRMRDYGYAGFWIRVRGLVPIGATARGGNALFQRQSETERRGSREAC